jgi:hypothetical protein
VKNKEMQDLLPARALAEALTFNFKSEPAEERKSTACSQCTDLLCTNNISIE